MWCFADITDSVPWLMYDVVNRADWVSRDLLHKHVAVMITSICVGKRKTEQYYGCVTDYTRHCSGQLPGCGR